MTKRRLDLSKPAPLDIPVTTHFSPQSKQTDTASRSPSPKSETQSPNSTRGNLIAPCPIKSPLSRTAHWFDERNRSKKNTQISSSEARAEDEIRNILLTSPTSKRKCWGQVDTESSVHTAPACPSRSAEPHWLLDTPEFGPSRDFSLTPPIPRPGNPLPADKRFPEISTPPLHVPRKHDGDKDCQSREQIGAELGVFRFSPAPQLSESNMSKSTLERDPASWNQLDEYGMFHLSPSVRQTSPNIQGRA